jgi:OPA family sugar phosphate sensor protein UhpC-like MFS transporter
MSALLKFFAPGPTRRCSATRDTIDTLYKRHRFRIMVAITLGYGLSYTCRLALGMVKKPLIDAGVFSPTELGLIGSALFYTYAFGKLTNGFLADHANMKRFFAFSVLISAIANIGMGFSTTVACRRCCGA